MVGLMKQFIKKHRYEIYAFVLTGLIVCLNFGIYRKLPWQERGYNGDSLCQIVPISTLLVKKLLNGSDFFYSSFLGMGGNTTISFWFHAMSPFVFLYLLSDSFYACFLAFMLKLSFAALFFVVFSKKCLKRDGIEALLFALAYALCGYSFGYADSMMLDAIFFLPVILVSVKYAYDNKKISVLCISYTIMFLSNFYVAYLVGLSSFGYFVLLLVLSGNDKKNNIKAISRYMISVLCALLIASVFIVPALCYEFGLQNAFDGSFEYHKAGFWQIVSSFMVGNKVEFGYNIPYFYCGTMVLFLLPVFFKEKELSKKEKIIAFLILAFLILGLENTALYRALHMFNNPNSLTVRFAYLFVFCIASIGVRCFCYVKKLKLKELFYIAIFISLLFLTSHVFDDGISSMKQVVIEEMFVWGYFMILCLYIISQSRKAADTVSFCYMQKKRQRMTHLSQMGLIIIAVMELSVNAYFLQLNGVNQDELVNINEVSSELLEDADDNFRVEMNGDLNPNQAMISDYRGINEFSSGINPQLTQTMYKLGFVTSNDCLLYSYGLSDVTRMLFAVKYRLDFLNRPQELEIRNSVLPIAYLVRSDVEKLKEHDAFYNNNELLTAFSGQQIDAFEECFDVTVDSSGVNVYINEKGILCMERDPLVKGTAWVKFEIPKKENCTTYMYWDTGVDGGSSNAPFVNVENDKELALYYNGCVTYDRIFKMDEEDGCSSAFFLMREGDMDALYLKSLKFAYLDNEKIEDVYQSMKDNAMDVDTFEDGYIKGYITVAGESEKLFISIPKEPGWTAYIDGNETDIIGMIENTYMGIEIPKGKHTVELEYTAPGKKMGRILGVIGIGLLLMCVFTDLKKNREW